MRFIAGLILGGAASAAGHWWHLQASEDARPQALTPTEARRVAEQHRAADASERANVALAKSLELERLVAADAARREAVRRPLFAADRAPAADRRDLIPPQNVPTN